MKKITIILILLYSINVFSQEQSYKSTYNYSTKYKFNSNNIDIKKISNDLTSHFNNDTLKVFSIVCFIIKNINYDYDLADKILNNKKYDDNLFKPTSILKLKKTVCSGYSKLFMSLCEYSNIKCGYIIGIKHEYNWVLINNQYKIIDITYLDGNKDNLLTKWDINKKIADIKTSSLNFKEKYDYISNIKKINKFIFDKYKTPLNKLNDNNIDSIYKDILLHRLNNNKEDSVIIDIMKKNNMSYDYCRILYNEYYIDNKSPNNYFKMNHHKPKDINIELPTNTIKNYDSQRILYEKINILLNNE